MGEDCFLEMRCDPSLLERQRGRVADMWRDARREGDKLSCIAMEGMFRAHPNVAAVTVRARRDGGGQWALAANVEFDTEPPPPASFAASKEWRRRNSRREIVRELESMLSQDQLARLAQGCHVKRAGVFEALGPALMGDDGFSAWRAQCEARQIEAAAIPPAQDRRPRGPEARAVDRQGEAHAMLRMRTGEEDPLRQAKAVSSLRESARLAEAKLTCIRMAELFEGHPRVRSLEVEAYVDDGRACVASKFAFMDGSSSDGALPEGAMRMGELEQEEALERVLEEAGRLWSLVSQIMRPDEARAAEGAQVVRGRVFETLGPLLMGREDFEAWRAQSEAFELDEAAAHAPPRRKAGL